MSVLERERLREREMNRAVCVRHRISKYRGNREGQFRTSRSKGLEHELLSAILVSYSTSSLDRSVNARLEGSRDLSTPLSPAISG